MMTKKAMLFVLAIILSSVLYGQNFLLEGKVLDAKYLTPVPYAVIYIQNTINGTIADNVGKFSLETPSSLNNVTLVISREKYNLSYINVEKESKSDIVVFLEPNSFPGNSIEYQNAAAATSNRFTSTINRATELVKDDWIPLGNPETSGFDFGRTQTSITYNPIESVRLRAGVASNSKFNPHFFINSYVAYGFYDQMIKYRGELSYSIDKKVYHENEFPKNKIALVYENDLYSPGEMHPRSPNNMLLITHRRSENEATYRNFVEMNYEREYKNGIAHILWLRKVKMVPQGDLRFDYHMDDLVLTDTELYTSEAGILIRYSLREAYEQQKRKRKSIEMTSPVFFLSHIMGSYKQFDKFYTYHRSEFSLQKRFLLGYAGQLDVVGEGMKVWNSVPFPLLVYPNQRQKHNIENSAFFLNRALEFVADQQYSLRFTFSGDDLLLAKIPILNQMQMRELISVRGSYGRLSKKNIPGFAYLYNFPEVSSEYGSKPYIEGTIGVTNIFGLLRVEYVHRFTYRDKPEALLGKIRVDIML